MTLQSYLILMRDPQLALAVGSALEARLTGDGHDALALVPAGHWQERARPGRGACAPGTGGARNHRRCDGASSPGVTSRPYRTEHPDRSCEEAYA
jgi:hypothetical protein